MSLFPPHKGENKFQFFVPPNGHAICLAMRTADWGQYWFNLDSKYFTLHCQAGEDPTNTPELNEELFISQDVCFDDEEDEDYYDYVSSSHEEAKSELKFKHINLKDVALEDLKNDYPKIIEMLLALPGEDDESYIWNKIVFNDSYYVGQLDAKTRQRRGRGAYHWEDDGITYVGYWENSQKEGSGILFDKNFSPTYEGGFLKGLKHGKGRYCFKNGDVYEGGFFEDKKHGKGTYTWKSGGSWSGPYANGQMHGKGMFTNKSGNSWEIEYRNDKAL
jgi:hypothetical protein